MTSSTLMNAAVVREFGDPSVIRYERVPRPAPGPGQVLIRVAAASFNPSDAGLRSGALRGVLSVAPPFVIGADVSGTVIETGAGLTAFAPGDEVIGRLDGGGSFAEYAIGAGELVRAPATIPLADAAAIPVAGLTAWQALFEHAAVAPGDRVLISGAGGGVGMFAVQLARHAGAHVIATASPRSAAAVRDLGADQVVDYTRTTLADALDAPVDLALNLVGTGPRDIAALLPLVSPGGSLVSITAPVEAPPGSGVRTAHFVARNDPAQLAELVALIDAGVVAVGIAGSRPLAEAASVHRDGEAGRLRGKTTLTP